MEKEGEREKFSECSGDYMFGCLLKSEKGLSFFFRDVYSTNPTRGKKQKKKHPRCQSEACFHLGLDGTGVKQGTAASGPIKSGCEVLARQ